jgi:hypothetical protein
MAATETRLRRRWAELAAAGRKGLVAYLTQGDPSVEGSIDVVQRVAEAGADVIELGVPFSDPNADGVVIQAAMQRARARGGGLASAMAGVAELRRRGCEVPVVLFGYYNPIFVHGVERFARDAAAAGVDAVLTVDLPIDELDELRLPLGAAGVDVVPLVACVGGGSNAAGLFAPFEADAGVAMFGVEAAGEGVDTDRHAATLSRGRVGVLHGSMSYVLCGDDGQIQEAHSISAGLDYPGVGPEHSHWKDSGRAVYVARTDAEALEGLTLLARTVGVLCALETAHAFAALKEVAARVGRDGVVIVCVSGRGDKDMVTVAKAMGEKTS